MSDSEDDYDSEEDYSGDSEGGGMHGHYDSEHYDSESDYEDDWDSEDEANELAGAPGFHLNPFTRGFNGMGGGHDGIDPASIHAPPVRCRVTPKTETGKCVHRNHDPGTNDHASFGKQPCETSLGFYIRKSMWAEARTALGAKAIAAGAAGTRLVCDEAVKGLGGLGVGLSVTDLSGTKAGGKGGGKDVPQKGKDKGKAPAKGKGKAAAEKPNNKDKTLPKVDCFDLINAIVTRAPADITLALLAIAPLCEIKHRVRKERGTARNGAGAGAGAGAFQGCSLLHFAMYGVNPLREAQVHKTPTPLVVVKRLLDLDPESIAAVSTDGFTPMFVLARFGAVEAGACDETMAQSVDAMVLVSKNAKPGTKLRKACGGAATKVVLVKYNAPAESLRGIVAGELLEKKTSKMYPLHGACVRHQVATLTALVKAFPDAAKTRVEITPDTSNTGSGRSFPLHLLFMSSPGKQVCDLGSFKAVLDAFPDAALEPSNTRDAPQHVLHWMCCHHDMPVGLIKLLLRTVPQTAKVVESGETALHIALDYRAGEGYHRSSNQHTREEAKGKQHEIVKALLRAYPEGVSIADNDGVFPIHIAVKNKLEPVLCKQILAKDPHAAEKKDNDGDLPLHVATRDGSFDLVKAILEVAPRLAEIATEEDGLPLHVAARHSAPAAVTRLLLQTYPDGVRKEDSEGELPLHAVCAALGSDDLMDETSEAENENDKRDFENAKVLYDHFPEGAFHTDSRGKIPAERLPMYDVHRMLSRDVFGGDTWRGEGWRVVAAGDAALGAGGARSNAGVTGNGGNRSGAPNVPSTTANLSSYTQHPNPHASGAALLVRVAANENAVAAMSASEIERLGVAVERARAALGKETSRRPFEETLLQEHEEAEKKGAPSWMCPIGYGLFRDPVTAGDGMVYERSNIVKWQEKSGAIAQHQPTPATLDGGAHRTRVQPSKRKWKSPMTGLPCDDFTLVGVLDIKNAIDARLETMVAKSRGGAFAKDKDQGKGKGKGKDTDTSTAGEATAGEATAKPGSKGTKRGGGKDAAPGRATRARRG